MEAKSIGLVLFFSLEIIGGVSLQNQTLRRLADHPLLAVGIITGSAKGIVGDDVIHQFFLAVIVDLMGLVRSEKKNVARRNFRHTAFVSHAPDPGENDIKFPLR